MIKIDLNLKRIGITATSARYELLDQGEMITNHLMHSLSALFASETQEPFVHQMPATWWDHLKQDWFPAWAKLRWPPKMDQIILTIDTVYPFLKTALPEEHIGARVTVLVNNQSIGSFLPETSGMSPTQWREEAKSILFRERFKTSYKCKLCGRAYDPLANHDDWKM